MRGGHFQGCKPKPAPSNKHSPPTLTPPTGQNVFPQPEQEKTLRQISSDSGVVSSLVLTMTSLHVPRCLGHLRHLTLRNYTLRCPGEAAPCLSPSSLAIFFHNISAAKGGGKKKKGRQKFRKKSGLKPPSSGVAEHSIALRRHVRLKNLLVPNNGLKLFGTGRKL